MLHNESPLGIPDGIESTELAASEVSTISESTIADIGFLLSFVGIGAVALYANRNMLKTWWQK